MTAFALKRSNGPVLEPVLENSWESGAVFNPGTIRQGETVQMIYRAVEGKNFSTIGYAKLDRYGNVLERHKKPVIAREWDAEKQGCEDPRIVSFEGSVYVFYTAYDGSSPDTDARTRVMMAETSDFLNYHKIGIVGPDANDKDAMIFPQKIGGKVAFLHRIVPNIQLAYFDDLQHFIQPESGYWKKHLYSLDKHTILFPESNWEMLKIGAGPPPLLTEAGWLLIYHGVDRQRVYRAGALLLDEKKPEKVIARLPYPILEPAREYERVGDVDMVVFPEGMAQFGDELQIYYGCADKVIGLATGSLSHLIEELWKHRVK